MRRSNCWPIPGPSVSRRPTEWTTSYRSSFCRNNYSVFGKEKMSQPNAARIKTTTVGSYPIPDWLVALPSEQALIDATRVVISTQEEAGIDVVCDGELY